MSLKVVKIREFQGHSQAVYSLCKDKDPYSFYSAGGDGMLVRWHMDEMDGLRLTRHESAVYALYAEGHFLISGTKNGLISVFDTNNFKLFRNIQLSNSPVFDILKFNSFILVATGDGNLFVLDADFSILKTIRISDKSLRKIELMDQHIAISGSDGIIRILDKDLLLTSEINAQTLTIFALAYQSDTKKLICGGREATLNFYRDKECFKTIKAHLLHIHCIALNDDHTMFLTCSMDKSIKLWDALTDDLLKVIDYEKYGGHTSSVNKILWFDKKKFISCSDDRTLKCFEIQET